MALPSPYDITADNEVVSADSAGYTIDGAVSASRTFDPTSLLNPGKTVAEIPLTGRPQTFTIDLAGATYRLRLAYAAADEAGWLLDIADDQDVPLVRGIPLVVGLDLLGPYKHLGIGGRMFIATAGDPSAVPGFGDLGTRTRLYFEIA